MVLEEIKKFLEKNKIFNLDKKQQLISVVKLVAQIPWDEGRTIEETLVIKCEGTCTGKHLVLQSCLDELKIECQPVVCTFHWSEQGIQYPQNLQNILDEGEWEHGHNFLKIKKENGDWIDIDIMWNPNPSLEKYGFKILPQNWDGETSFTCLKKIIQRWDGVEMEKIKKQLIESLPPAVKERRVRFLKGMFEWFKEINK